MTTELSSGEPQADVNAPVVAGVAQVPTAPSCSGAVRTRKRGEPLPHAGKPCANCPFRKDSPAGEFDTERFDTLRATSRDPRTGQDALPGSPIFACHKSVDGREIACAGWLAVEGYGNLTVRLALAYGELDPAALQPAPDGPELHASYNEVAVKNGCEDWGNRHDRRG